MDSDDEHDRRPRGRDKFRRERSDYNERSGGRRDERSSRRDDWSDRRRPMWGDSRRKDYRNDFDRDRRDSGGGRHHDISPPMKRVRRDWDNVGYQDDYNHGFNPNMQANQWVPPMEMQPNIHPRQFESPQQQHPIDMKLSHGPAMMSFKQFLNSMEDSIDDMEAVKKYQEYKVEFRKTQIADFFTTHKDEEWFRNKYHPVDTQSYQTKVIKAVKKRAMVFIDLLQAGWLEKHTLTTGQGEDIVKLLDAAVIKFEGGTDFDLQVLSKPDDQEEKKKHLNSTEEKTADDPSHTESKVAVSEIEPVSPSSVPLPETPAPASATVKTKPEDIKPLEMSDPSPEQMNLRVEAEKYHQQHLQQQEELLKENQSTKTEDQQPGNERGQKRKRKRRHREPYYYDENVESESESESDIESEPAPPGEETAKRDAQERAAEERLLPPGIEPVSNDELTSDQDGTAPQHHAATEVDSETAKTAPVMETEAVAIDPPVVEPEAAAAKNSETVSSEKHEQETPEETAKPSSPAAKETVTEETGPVAEQEEDAKEVVAEMKEEEQTKNVPEVKQDKQEEKEELKSVKDNPNNMETSSNADDKPKVEGIPATEGITKEDAPSQVEVIKNPRPLHQTVSLFVRNVPPKISNNDITSVCSRFPGFMRVVLSDPSPERKFSRRGWITFKPNVNIKDICWTINNMKIKEVELNPIVNRELARRIRSVSGASVLKQIVETDITMAKKLIEQLDEKYKVWLAEEERVVGKESEESAKKAETKVEEKTEENSEDPSVAQQPTEESTPPQQPQIVEPPVKLPKSNPVLDLLPANLSTNTSAAPETAEAQPVKAGDEEGQVTEEGQVPEEGESVAPAQSTTENPGPVVDEELIKILDRLVLYLRIVHSLDYYSGAEYLYEDAMPHRCGIIHIRNTLPEKINYDEVNEWHKNLHVKLAQHLKTKERLSDEEASQLGRKDQEQEMEKFVQVNTQELAKDKWLCPLSGKKFRGPEFVKKHIFNKHGDKVEGVKTEVTFFNNFVYDPNRPNEPDIRPPMPGMPGNPGFSHPMGMPNMGWGRGGGMMQPGRGGFVPNMSPGFRGGPEQYNNRGGQGFQNKQRRGVVRRDPRQIIKYTDLDAPGEEMDFF